MGETKTAGRDAGAPLRGLAARAARLPGRWARALADRYVRGGAVRALASRSMLAPGERDTYRLAECPVCGSSDVTRFFELPFNFPEGQNHALLYFDPRRAPMDEVLEARDRLDRAVGLFVLVPWVFCSGCTVVALDTVFPEGHLERYYAELYRRAQPMHANRRRTKELHGAFVADRLAGGARVLEIGAAEGFVAAHLASRGFDVWANELNREHVEALRALEGVHVVTDLDDAPEGTFDCVLAHHVLEHVPDPADFTARLGRLLRYGGILVLQVPDIGLQLAVYQRYLRRSPVNALNPYRLDLDGVDYRFAPGPGYPWLDALNNDHVLAYTPESLESLVRRAGLEVATIERSTAERITYDPGRYAWPVDETTGNTPNGLTLVARKPGSVSATPKGDAG